MKFEDQSDFGTMGAGAARTRSRTTVAAAAIAADKSLPEFSAGPERGRTNRSRKSFSAGWAADLRCARSIGNRRPS